MESPADHYSMDWSKERNNPRPDYLSSSRKRLVPQLIYKGGILTAWNKRTAVALHRSFFETLPQMEFIEEAQAEMMWMVYDLQQDDQSGRFHLVLLDRLYTRFQAALNTIATPIPGSVADFTAVLQDRLDRTLDDEQNPPDAPSLDELL